MVSQTIIHFVRHPVKSLDIVLSKEMGRQSFIEAQLPFLGMKTIRDSFHADGIFWYLRHNVNMLERVWASGSTEHQWLKMRRSIPGAVFSAEESLAQISPGENFSKFISSAVDSQLSYRERSQSGVDELK